MRCRVPFCLMLLCALPLMGQSTPPVTRDDLPPSAVLSDEMSSFERIRSDMANWSEVEMAAFESTTKRAKADCARIEQAAHEGEEALALARLCAVGLDWDGTYSAARWYTRRSAPTGEALHLPIGFALLVKADLNLQNIRNALDDLKEMQSRLPLDADTDSIFEYTIEAMEVTRPEDAVKAATLRGSSLLDAVSGKNAALSAGQAEAEAWHVLGMLHDAEQAEGKAALLQAVASRALPLAVADQYAAQRGRTQFEWLGRVVPRFAVSRSTYLAVPRRAAVPVKATLLVIEDAGAADVPALALAVDSLRIRSAPGSQAKLVLTGPASPMGRVRAVFTADALLETFAAAAGPLFVVVDGEDRVRWMGAGAAAWLNPQQQAETLLERVSR